MVVTGNHKDKLIASKKSLVHLIKSTDKYGYPMWHYILIKKTMRQQFSNAIKNKQQIEFAKYGEVIEAGFGKKPPEEIVTQLYIKYGFRDSKRSA